MRVKIEGFATRQVMHSVIDQLFDYYHGDLHMMTGTNIYYTPRSEDGTELELKDPQDVPIEMIKLLVKPKKSVSRDRKPAKPTPPKLVAIPGGKAA